jgi:DNA polymerase III epsilon subunit-like protein
MIAHDFFVIDTEGNPLLTEIAIVNSIGKVIYFTEVKQKGKIQPHAKPLLQVLQEVSNLVQNKTLIFHYAEHDLNILKNSYINQQINLPIFNHLCSWELSKRLLFNQKSYSLDYLSQKLGLKVDNKYFNPNQAHSARYDALFTYQLYLHLRTQNVHQSI